MKVLRNRRLASVTAKGLTIALAVYTRNPAAYKSLSSFQLLHPGTLKTYSCHNVEVDREVEVCLADERVEYDDCVKGHMATSKPYPSVCKGVLIFDEVKVAARNSRNDNFVGHTMTNQGFRSLLCNCWTILHY